VVVVLALLAGSGAAAVLLDPAARVRGWAGGEPFFQGRAATAWRKDLRDPDEVRRTAAQKALADGKGEAVPVCAWLLKHAAEPEVRWRAADALNQMGKDAAAAGPDLVTALSDPDALVRDVAAQAVGKLAPDVPGAVPALVKLFPDKTAVRAVSNFKRAGAEAVPHLLPLLNDPKLDVPTRRQVIRTLGKIGEPAKAAVPALIELTDKDPDAGIREQAAEALGDIGPGAAAEGIPALVRALKHPAAMVRRDAVRSLGQMGPAAKGVLADVKPLTADPDERVREAAARAVRQIDPEGR
jgi:HEAT repeat protein